MVQVTSVEFLCIKNRIEFQKNYDDTPDYDTKMTDRFVVTLCCFINLSSPSLQTFCPSILKSFLGKLLKTIVS